MMCADGELPVGYPCEHSIPLLPVVGRDERHARVRLGKENLSSSWKDDRPSLTRRAHPSLKWMPKSGG